jgi:hypothetical protein
VRSDSWSAQKRWKQRKPREDEGWDSFWWEARRDTCSEVLSHPRRRGRSPESSAAQRSQGCHEIALGCWLGCRRQSGSRRRKPQKDEVSESQGQLMQRRSLAGTGMETA